MSAGQVPYYYAHRRPGRADRTRFITVKNQALFPFGHGLTYGKISYSDLILAAKQVSPNGRLRVTSTVRNDGSRAARELVQLYVQDVVASVTQPIRELKAYQHVDLAPGQARQVSFTLAATELSFLDKALKPTIEAGTFKLWVAPSAEAPGQEAEFELIAT